MKRSRQEIDDFLRKITNDEKKVFHQKREPVSGVYIIFTKDGDQYIGGTSDIGKRFSNHKSRMKNHNHSSTRLQSIYDDNGLDYFKFEILLICDKENIHLYEQIAIDILKPSLNLSVTAEFTTHSEETRIKMSNSQLGHKVSDQTRDKISAANRGSKRSHEVRLKMSESQKGRKHSEETRRQMSKSAILLWKERKNKDGG